MAEPRSKRSNKENNSKTQTYEQRFSYPAGVRKYAPTAKPAPTSSDNRKLEMKRQSMSESRVQNADRNFVNKKINRGAAEKQVDRNWQKEFQNAVNNNTKKQFNDKLKKKNNK